MVTKPTPKLKRPAGEKLLGVARPRKRAEQLRAMTTRAIILSAALTEFADKGFEAASIRGVAEKTGLQHPLITHHFGNKEGLWQAAAEQTFERVRAEWDARAPVTGNLSPLARLRVEYEALFRHTVAFPDFHRFMRQEAVSENPRLHWLARKVLKPLIERLLPQIEEAQAQGELPRIEPILFHYMMVSLTATLSEFGAEMKVTRGLSAEDPKVVDAYWNLVERLVFAPLAVIDSIGASPGSDRPKDQGDVHV
jgi:AcrR family transcriptional regulator